MISKKKPWYGRCGVHLLSLWVWNGLATFFDHQMWSVEGLCQPALGPALKKLCWALLPTKVSYFSMCSSFKPPTRLHTCQRRELFLSVHPQSPVRSLWIARTSLAAQWLRVCLAMQGTWVPPLVRELRTRVPKLLSPCVPEPKDCNWSPVQLDKRSHVTQRRYNWGWRQLSNK